MFIGPDPEETQQGFIGPDPEETPAPSDTVAKLRQDPEFQPDPAALKAAYDQRLHVDPSQMLEGVKGLGQQLFVDLPKKFAAQEQAEIDKGALPYLANLPGRAMRTGVEGLAQGTAQLGDLIRKPLQSVMDDFAATIVDPTNPDLRRQMWADRVRAEGENATAMAPYYEGDKSFVPGAAPAASALAGNVLDPSLLIPGGKAAGAAARGLERTAAGVAAEAAAKGGLARTAAGIAAPAVEKTAETAGRAAETAAGVIDKVQPVADTIGAVTGGVSGLGATHAAGRGASLALKWASKIRDSGTALRNIAGADWRSTQPIYAQLAKDIDAPVWLRRAASSSIAPAVEATLRGSAGVAKGAAEGLAIGAAAVADDTLTPEEKGSALGQGAAFGAGGGAAGRAMGGAARAEARQAHDIAVRMQRTIESGANPEAVLSASDAVMFYADNIEKLFKGAMPGGKDLRVELQDATQFAAKNGPGVAYFEPAGPDGNPRVVVNIENPDADARILHEAVGHALMDSLVSSKPEILVQIRAAVDRASGGTSPNFLQAASEQYAKALLPNATPEEQAAYITQQRVRSAEMHGDQDAWILSEIGSEAAVRAVGGRGVLDLATPGFFGRMSRAVRDRFPALGAALEAKDVGGVKQQFPGSDKTFFGSLISQALSDESLHGSIVGGMRDLGSYRPGIDAPQERGVKVTSKDFGSQPFATLHDLGGGQKGTDFVVQTPDGRVVARPPSQVRQLARNRQKAVNTAVPMDGPPAPYPDVDGTVKLRRTISGLVERSGTKLGNWFYGSNFFSQTTKDLAKRLEQAIGSGEALAGWYHQIGESMPDWRQSVERDYGNIEAKFKDFLPINFLITKVGNLIVRNYSLSSFQKKAAQWSARQGPASLELWNGDVGQFSGDVQRYLANHREGRPGADGIGEQKRDVINAFLIGRNATFEAKNPLRAALRGQDAQGLVRSYRLDRLEPVEPSQLTGYQQPSYEKQVRNLSPDASTQVGVDNPQNSAPLPDAHEKDTSGRLQGGRFRIDPAVRGRDFAAAIRRTKAEHKLGFAVDDKGDEFYTNPANSVYLSEDGLGGVAVTDYGDLVSVFKHPASKTNLYPILKEASERATTLDAFDINGFLPDLYAKFGFKPVARVPFNKEFAPPGWDYSIAGEPDVVLMVNDAQNKLGIPEGKYAQIRDSVPVFTDYDQAAAAQQAAKAKIAESRQFSPDTGDKTLTERIAEEGPAKIMITSALNLLHKDSDRLPPPEKKRDNGKVAEAIQLAAIEQWGRPLNSSDITPEEKDVIIANATEEAVAALAASGKNAYDWYTTAIEAATEVMSVIHPELRDDAAAKATGNFENAKGARLGMMMAMAITSQNLTVALNSRFAEEQFAALKSTGRFDPAKEYGEKAESISGNLALANTALDKFGWDGLDKFLASEFTVKELSAALTETLGRKVSIAGRAKDVVNGAALFGPKIGQGFLQNLRGNFTPVTVDLWMRRTWGRWTGDVLGDGVTPERLARLVDAARSFGIALPKDIVSLRTVVRKNKSGTDYKTFSESLSDRIESDTQLRETVIKWSKELAAEWQRKYKLLRLPVMPESAEALKSGALNADALADRQEKVMARLDQQWARLKKAGKAPEGGIDSWRAKQLEAAGHTAELDSETLSDTKPEWAKAAIIIKNQLRPIDAPSDQDRAVITEIVNGVREKLEAQGKRVTNADIQAILWYPEKDLWAKLRGEKESNLKQQYDEEFLKIAEARGLGPQARAAADRVRATRSGATAESGAKADAPGPVDETQKD